MKKGVNCNEKFSVVTMGSEHCFRAGKRKWFSIQANTESEKKAFETVTNQKAFNCPNSGQEIDLVDLTEENDVYDLNLKRS